MNINREYLKVGLLFATRRKRGISRSRLLGSPFSPVRFGGQLSRNTGLYRIFQGERSGLSLHSRMGGGARSLSLTLLRLNSLLTGKNTGNLRNSAPENACFSL